MLLLHGELIIKVSHSFVPPPVFQRLLWGSEFPQVGQDQEKEGCRVEFKRDEGATPAGLMPGVDGCFCLVVSGALPILSAAVHA